MTPEQLKAIATRNAARTQGEFKVVSRNPKDGLIVGTDYCTPVFYAYRRGDIDTDDIQTVANAEFLTNAPGDITALLAYVAQLEGLLADAAIDGGEGAAVAAARKEERARAVATFRRLLGASGKVSFKVGGAELAPTGFTVGKEAAERAIAAVKAGTEFNPKEKK
jgi:hypothetical protein